VEASVKLTFPWTDVTRALEELHTAQTTRTLYEAETGKGLWLVGDHGVYLMPNTTDGRINGNRAPDDMHFVVYASECDPTKMDFDEWGRNKRASFGGDDGVDFIPLADIEALAAKPPKRGARPRALSIDITPKRLSVAIEWGLT
jgi:DUF3085 family protein